MTDLTDLPNEIHALVEIAVANREMGGALVTARADGTFDVTNSWTVPPAQVRFREGPARLQPLDG